MDQSILSRRLKTWFIIHFILDVAAAIPLLCAPVWFLRLLGWNTVDPFAARLVAAALFGIGIESWLGRGGDRATFSHMLNLKIIWSASAVVGIALSMIQTREGVLPAHWLVLVIFLAFHLLWVYFRYQVGRAAEKR